jgi:hypothetical protein
MQRIFVVFTPSNQGDFDDYVIINGKRIAHASAGIDLD